MKVTHQHEIDNVISFINHFLEKINLKTSRYLSYPQGRRVKLTMMNYSPLFFLMISSEIDLGTSA